MHSRVVNIVVGLFMLAGLVGLLILAFEVSGLTGLGNHEYYQLTAEFDDIGSLKPRAPISISGVTVGRVKSIYLDNQTYRAKVTMQIDKKFNQIPVDSAASIYTEGLIGSNYIHIEPGLDMAMLKPGGKIETTHSALILENLIGQLLYSFKSSSDAKNSTDDSKNSTEKSDSI